MWTRFLKALGLIEPDCCRAVREWLQNSESTLELHGAECLGQEGDRWIVRIFYQDPARLCKPSPYRVFWVSAELKQITELPCGPDSPYYIFGRK